MLWTSSVFICCLRVAISASFVEYSVGSVGIMFRMLNPKNLFATLNSHSFNDISVRLKLEIKDSFLKVNDKPLVVYFENGFPVLKSVNSKTDVTLTINTSDFSSLLLGAVNLKSLHNYGLAEVSNDKYVEILYRLFYRDEKPVCLHQF